MAKTIRTDIGPFAIVPLWLIQDASPRALRIYAVMAAKWADRDTGECYPFRQTIGDEIGVSADTIDRGLAELEGLGAIEIKPQYDSKGDQTCNLYKLFTVPDPSREYAATPPQDCGDPSSDLRPPRRKDAAAGEPESFNQNHITRELPSSLPSTKAVDVLSGTTSIATTPNTNDPRERSTGIRPGCQTDPILSSLSEDGTLAPAPQDHGPQGNSTGRPGVDDTPDPEVVRLCTLLADLYHQNGNTRPNPNQKSWYRECRLLMTKDGPDGNGRPPEKIEKVMRWALQNPFWRTNIRSMPKLREKYDTLREQAIEEHNKKKSDKQQSNTDKIAEYERKMKERES